jgi:hypothetical protein
MTDFVQPTAIQPTTRPALLALPGDSNALQLSGAGTSTPLQVNVQVDASGTAQFSAPGATTQFPKIEWKPPQDQTVSASITFTFVTGGNTPISMTSDATQLTFDAVKGTQQTGHCLPTQGNRSFRVTYKTQSGQTNTTGDPIIIVTPPSL